MRNQHFFSSYILVSKTCGLTEQKLFANPGIIHGLINTPIPSVYYYVDKTLIQTGYFTQGYQFLCTVFQHILHTISSVKWQVVHIFHNAYKKNDELKKGII